MSNFLKMNFKLITLYISILIIFSSKLNAQHIRTFNVWGYEFGTNKNAMNNSFYYGQKLTYGQKVKFNFGLGFTAAFNRFEQDSISSLYSNDNQKLNLTSRSKFFFINSPVIASVGFYGFEFGFATDVFGYTFNRKLNGDYFNVVPSISGTNNFINPKGFNWLFAKKTNRRNLVTKIFGSYTINDTFTIMAGMASQNYFFNFTSTDTNNITSERNRFGDKLFYPFVSIRLNNEK